MTRPDPPLLGPGQGRSQAQVDSDGTVAVLLAVVLSVGCVVWLAYGVMQMVRS